MAVLHLIFQLQFLYYNHNLTFMTDDEINSHDVGFIGCWWLGSVVFSGMNFIVLLWMFVIPKHFSDYYIYHKKVNKDSAERRSNDDGGLVVVHVVKGNY